MVVSEFFLSWWWWWLWWLGGRYERAVVGAGLVLVRWRVPGAHVGVSDIFAMEFDTGGVRGEIM